MSALICDNLSARTEPIQTLSRCSSHCRKWHDECVILPQRAFCSLPLKAFWQIFMFMPRSDPAPNPTLNFQLWPHDCRLSATTRGDSLPVSLPNSLADSLPVSLPDSPLFPLCPLRLQLAYILCTCNQFAPINSMGARSAAASSPSPNQPPLVSLLESPRGASCARLRHGQIKAKSKRNGAAYNPLLQQIKIYYTAGKRHTSRKSVAATGENWRKSVG